MSDDENQELEELRRVYRDALHAVQTGIEHLMGLGWRGTSRKDLRVGVDSMMASHRALVDLLILKGLFTEKEYLVALASSVMEEKASYERECSEASGAEVKLL